MSKLEFVSFTTPDSSGSETAHTPFVVPRRVVVFCKFIARPLLIESFPLPSTTQAGGTFEGPSQFAQDDQGNLLSDRFLRTGEFACLHS